MLTEFKFNSIKYDKIEVRGNKNDQLTNLSKLNILIGANNSSKSRFLRNLFLDDDIEIEVSELKLDGLMSAIEIVIENVERIFKKNNLKDANDLLKKLYSLRNYKFKLGDSVFKNHILETVNLMKNDFRPSSYSKIDNRLEEPTIMDNSFSQAIKEESAYLQSNLLDSIPDWEIFTYSKLYIPILRGLRPILTSKNDSKNEFSIESDVYLNRTIHDYFPNLNKKRLQEISTGLTFYDDLQKMLLGKRDQREHVKDFEMFLGKTFFQNKTINLIPYFGPKQIIHIGIGGEEERPIYELGDGIQAIITILFPLFMNAGNDNRKRMLVFIEEPENCLHPGMQRILLETLMGEKFQNFQFFITTHSNHFLDLTLDINNISVFTFHKVQRSSDTFFEIENANRKDLKVLDLLGVRNSSVFLSNCTIWVEGITDRLYLKKYLEVFQKTHQPDKSTFREDFHFAFVEYGGSNLVHWSFSDTDSVNRINASSVCNRIFLMADKDDTDLNPESEKASRLRKLKNLLGDRFHITDGIEVENLLSPSILVRVIEHREGLEPGSLASYATHLNISMYKDRKIGEFIHEFFPNLKRKYKSETGSLIEKVAFCKKAIELMDSMDDLSNEAISITNKIFQFIHEMNQSE